MKKIIRESGEVKEQTFDDDAHFEYIKGLLDEAGEDYEVVSV